MGGLETSGVIPIITAMRSQGPLVERNSRLPPLESCIHQLNTSLEQNQSTRSVLYVRPYAQPLSLLSRFSKSAWTRF
jgi:hypothetical protein